MLNRYESQDQELYDNNILLYELPLNTIDACCVNINTNNYICINKNRDYSSIDKYWITEHELEHIKTNSFYSVDTSKLSIRRREYKANDALIKKHNLATSTIELIKLGLCKSEICEELQIPLDLFDHIINYIKRKGIM